MEKYTINGVFMAVVINEADSYKKAFKKVSDPQAVGRMLARLTRIKSKGKVEGNEFLNFGDCKTIHGKVLMLKIDVGKGHRIYLARIGEQEFTAVHCGVKDTQDADILLAETLIASLT
jgi:putative addiction module killer protein